MYIVEIRRRDSDVNIATPSSQQNSAWQGMKRNVYNCHGITDCCMCWCSYLLVLGFHIRHNKTGMGAGRGMRKEELSELFLAWMWAKNRIRLNKIIPGPHNINYSTRIMEIRGVVKINFILLGYFIQFYTWKFCCEILTPAPPPPLLMTSMWS
jgi:hypothetical protein